MTTNKLFYLFRMWAKSLISVKAGAAILSSYGILWTFVEMTSYFLEGSKWPDIIRSLWMFFGFVGLVIAIIICRPKLSYSCKVNGRDVTIEIAVGDIFNFPGALIIGSNTTFDTRISRELISIYSVQGMFTKKYYGDETQVDNELSALLNGMQFETLTGNRIGKSKKYKIGTCVRLSPKKCTAYFLAIANINEHGTALGSFNDLKEALANLWIYIGMRGTKESLVMPVLGTGYARLSQTREEIIRETINSFIAACSEKTFTDKLTIVITPYDMVKYHISLCELYAFLCHQCRYVSFSSRVQPVHGTAL